MKEEYVDLLHKKIDFLEKKNKTKIKKYKHIILFLTIMLLSCICFYFYDNPKNIEIIIEAINLKNIMFIDIVLGIYLLSMVCLLFFIQYKILLKVEQLNETYE